MQREKKEQHLFGVKTKQAVSDKDGEHKLFIVLGTVANSHVIQT
jgi:hypothetical protein